MGKIQTFQGVTKLLLRGGGADKKLLGVTANLLRGGGADANFLGVIAKTVSEEVGQMQIFWGVIAKTFLEEVRLMQTFQGDTANLLRGGVADGYFSEGGQIKRHVNCSGGRGHTLNILGGR